MVAYREDPSYAIYVSRANGTGLHRLVRSSANNAALSFDGRLLAFDSGGKISIVGTDGRGLRRVTSGTADSEADWSPDGKALVFTGNYHGTVIVQPLRGKRRQLARVGLVGGPKWSPNGRWIAYAVARGHRPNGLYLVEPNGEHRHRVAPYATSFSWSPDGKRLAFTVGDAQHDVSDVAVADVDRRGIRRLRLGLSWWQAPTLTWSPDGRRLILAGHLGDDPEQIWMVGRDGRGLRRLTSAGTNSLVGWTKLAPVLPPARPIPPAERVIGARTVATRAPVTDLSADGPRVAFIPRGTATDCYHVAVWAPATKAILRVSPRLPAPCREGGQGGMYGVALAGSRIAWVQILGCGNSCDVALESATLVSPRPRDVLYGVFSADEGPRWDSHPHGDGDLFVFNDGSQLVRMGRGSEHCGEDNCTTLRRGAHSAPVDSVFGGLIAIREPDEVAVVDAQGMLVRIFPFLPEEVSAARLDGGSLVVARLAVLEVYDVATGARELSRPLPTGYKLADVDGGIALLRRAETIMLLRLDDGASRTFTPGRGPRFADLEPPGLYYSYATGEGGRLVFVPRSDLLPQLH